MNKTFRTLWYSLLVLAWICGFGLIGYSFLPIVWPESADIEYNEQILLVQYQVTTGPNYVVTNGHEFIKQHYSVSSHEESASGYEIELTGALPADRIALPIGYRSQYIVWGNIVGTTERYRETGSGSIPVFAVTSWRPTAYLPRLWASTSASYQRVVLITIVACLGVIVVSSIMLFRSYRKNHQSG